MASCNIKAARLRHRLTIQTLKRYPDGQGGFLETWIDGATIWAEVTPLKGYERMQAMQLASPVTHKILIRYRKGLTPANRLVYGLRTLEIKEVIDLEERHAWMQLICVEGEALPAPDSALNWGQFGKPWEALAYPWGESSPPWEAGSPGWEGVTTPWGDSDSSNWADRPYGWEAMNDAWGNASNAITWEDGAFLTTEGGGIINLEG